MRTEPDAFDVLCYGTISVDNVTYLPYLPSPKRDAPADCEFDEVGGEALRVAIPLATWGLRVVVVGNCIGTDRKADFILQRLARYPAIDTRHIEQHPSIPTPFTRTLLTPDGDRSRIAYHFDDIPKRELSPEIMARGRILSVDAYGRGERDRAAAVARGLGKVVISADAIWPQHPLAGISDAVIISRVWLRSNFPGVYEYDHALDLQATGAGVVIITDGARPVLVVRSDGSPFGVETYTIDRVVATAGAGDLFRAGVVYAWFRTDWSLEQKVRFACAASGLYCQRERGVESPPSLEQITALMEAQPR
jgi:sugar/nucleoside kinase (ribokinase family)